MLLKSWSVAYLSWWMAAIFSSFLEKEGRETLMRVAECVSCLFFRGVPLLPSSPPPSPLIPILIFLLAFRWTISQWFRGHQITQSEEQEEAIQTVFGLLYGGIILLQLCLDKKLVQIWSALLFIHIFDWFFPSHFSIVILRIFSFPAFQSEDISSDSGDSCTFLRLEFTFMRWTTLKAHVLWAFASLNCRRNYFY